MGQQGEAVLFLLPSEMGYLSMLQSAGCNIQELSLDEALQSLPSRGLAPVSPLPPLIRLQLSEIYLSSDRTPHGMPANVHACIPNASLT